MKINPYLRLLFLILMAIIGLIINLYYWQTEQFSAIKQVSVFIMTLVMVYIVLHFAKRFLFNGVKWWDWLYYIALLSVMLPVLMADSSNENLFHWLIDLGTFFFIIPIIFDIKEWYTNLKSPVE